jgi:hypothetical protein
VVDLLLDEVLDRRSVALAVPHDGIEYPEVLRRLDCSPVYTVAGADLYTSQRILDAEARLVAAAGRDGGRSVGGLEILITAVFMSADPQELYRQTSDPVRRQLNEVFFDRLYRDTDEVINDRAGGAIQ